MQSTVTDKGQVTVPKAIRDKIGIVPGSRLDFTLMEDGSLKVRLLSRGADRLFGRHHRPGQPTLEIEQMEEGIAGAVDLRNRRS